MASPIDAKTQDSRLDLLISKQEELDKLRAELDRVNKAHAKELRDIAESSQKQKDLLVKTALICRGLMERAEVWQTSPHIARHLVNVREELGPDAPGPNDIYTGDD